MRRSLAPHTRARWERAERSRILAEICAAQSAFSKAWDEQRAAIDAQLGREVDEHIDLMKQTLRLTFPTQPDFTGPSLTALQQRADRAERNARAWHRLALVLGVCALVALAACRDPYHQASGDLRMMVAGCKDGSTRSLRTDEPGKRTIVITCVPEVEAPK
jgi:hypothetical protein